MTDQRNVTPPVSGSHKKRSLLKAVGAVAAVLITGIGLGMLLVAVGVIRRPSPEPTPAPPVSHETASTSPQLPPLDGPKADVPAEPATPEAAPAAIVPAEPSPRIPTIIRPDMPKDFRPGEPGFPFWREPTQADFLFAKPRPYSDGMRLLSLVVPSEWFFYVGEPREGGRVVALTPEYCGVNEDGEFIVRRLEKAGVVGLLNTAAMLDSNLLVSAQLEWVPRVGIVDMDQPTQSTIYALGAPNPEAEKNKVTSPLGRKGWIKLDIERKHKQTKVTIDNNYGVPYDRIKGSETTKGHLWVEFPKKGFLQIRSIGVLRVPKERLAPDFLVAKPRQYPRQSSPHRSYLIAAEWDIYKGSPTGKGERTQLRPSDCEASQMSPAVRIKTAGTAGEVTGLLHRSALLDGDFFVRVFSEWVPRIGIVDPDNPEESTILAVPTPDPRATERYSKSGFAREGERWSSFSLMRQEGKLSIFPTAKGRDPVYVHGGGRTKGYLYIEFPEGDSFGVINVEIRRR